MHTPPEHPAPATAGGSPDGGMTLVLPQLFDGSTGSLEVEAQAANGLRLWRSHFPALRVAAGVRPADQPRPAAWSGVPAAALAERLGVELHPLPRFLGLRHARRNGGLRAYRAARARVAGLLGGLIARSRHLQFVPSLWLSDWGSLAGGIARAAGRPHCVHVDRVQERMVLDEAAGGPAAARLRAAAYARLLGRQRRRLVRGADLVLAHGADCLEAYAGVARRVELVHNVHTSAADRVGDERFEWTQAAASDPAAPLRVLYAGRADPDKGPLEWVEALGVARDAGARFEATWLGSGGELEAMRSRVADLGLADRVSLPGQADRAQTLAAMREAHVFLFCHKVPESPRCLIESLVSGTPLLGYPSRYSEQLATGHGGVAGLHAQEATPASLGAALATLAADRPRLAALRLTAREAGTRFDDESVFRHRAALIRGVG